MPYRRLPNTDAARIRAMEIILEHESDPDSGNQPFSPSTRQRIEFFLPRFRTAILNTQASREKQMANSKKYGECTKKARIYISHFLQVLNFTIIRGELKKTARTYYGIPENTSKLPSLATEQDLLEWGEKIIKGEQERIRNGGGTPIYSPSIALVKVNFENFKQAYFSQRQSQLSTSRLSNEVANYRHEADELILSLWNDIEENFSYIEDEEERRCQCETYGIIYVFRKGEKEKLTRKQEVDRITLKLPF